MELLFGEHFYALGKLAVAAAAGRKDEYKPYAGLLADNGGDVATLFKSALGETQGGQIGLAWTLANSSAVDYLVAVATHDQARANAAMAKLRTQYIPSMAMLLEGALAMSIDTATLLATEQVTATKLVIDDAISGNVNALYIDLPAAYAKAAAAGDAIATLIVSSSPDRYRGGAADATGTFRAELDALVQQHGYLLTMATRALFYGGAAEKKAAKAALGAAALAIAQRIGESLGPIAGAETQAIWAGLSVSLLAYAAAPTDDARQTAATALGDISAPQLNAFVREQSHLTVDVQPVIMAGLLAIDDQRNKTYGTLGRDDRQWALLMAGIGDHITGATQA